MDDSIKISKIFTELKFTFCVLRNIGIFPLDLSEYPKTIKVHKSGIYLWIYWITSYYMLSIHLYNIVQFFVTLYAIFFNGVELPVSVIFGQLCWAYGFGTVNTAVLVYLCREAKFLRAMKSWSELCYSIYYRAESYTFPSKPNLQFLKLKDRKKVDELELLENGNPVLDFATELVNGREDIEVSKLKLRFRVFFVMLALGTISVVPNFLMSKPFPTFYVFYSIVPEAYQSSPFLITLFTFHEIFCFFVIWTRVVGTDIFLVAISRSTMHFMNELEYNMNAQYFDIQTEVKFVLKKYRELILMMKNINQVYAPYLAWQKSTILPLICFFAVTCIRNWDKLGLIGTITFSYALIADCIRIFLYLTPLGNFPDCSDQYRQSWYFGLKCLKENYPNSQSELQLNHTFFQNTKRQLRSFPRLSFQSGGFYPIKMGTTMTYFSEVANYTITALLW